MRVLIVGASGSLATTLQEHIQGETNWELTGVGREVYVSAEGERPFSGSTRTAWSELFRDAATRPDVVVNTAAITNVDLCEIEREHAWVTNVELVKHIADSCRRNDIKLIQISTDNIFDGQHGPYLETADAHPVNYYGKTKLAAENECRSHRFNYAIVRTMWLYGAGQGRPSFVDWLAGELAQGHDVKIAEDEIGSPTLYEDVAYGIIRIIERDAQGTFNLAGPDILSRLVIAHRIADKLGLQRSLIHAVRSAELGRSAQRPLQSGLLTFKAQTLLGLRPTALDQGIETVQTRRSRGVQGRHDR